MGAAIRLTPGQLVLTALRGGKVFKQLNVCNLSSVVKGNHG
ncbi:MAG: hypothetical protein QXO47_07265 [Thermoproteota archaeon]